MRLIFNFDELKINIGGKTEDGALFYGKAELCENVAHRPAEGFYVKSIELDGGAKLDGESKSQFDNALFARILTVIMDETTDTGRHAALEWADEVGALQAA